MAKMPLLISKAFKISAGFFCWDAFILVSGNVDNGQSGGATILGWQCQFYVELPDINYRANPAMSGAF